MLGRLHSASFSFSAVVGMLITFQLFFVFLYSETLKGKLCEYASFSMSCQSLQPREIAFCGDNWPTLHSLDRFDVRTLPKRIAVACLFLSALSTCLLAFLAALSRLSPPRPARRAVMLLAASSVGAAHLAAGFPLLVLGAALR
eukprot:CAMPEP_0113664408 /NCGR_PEP_ID=MMETSP0038_2-20120614/1716_1 /TAXON_ID=2898 /ORGANISM="Cryptomonas paramecium" /LENGTH=142 /DNA_ID=CAMNT_0000579613 /DNA_START=303 /DNA_END=728 /DNA_ORIENTATION=- /assembly_acc=CAM_ASM_000170